MDEGRGDVGLRGVEVELGGKNHEQPNSMPVHNWRPGLEEIDTLDLSIATDTLAGLSCQGCVRRVPSSPDCPLKSAFPSPLHPTNGQH
jgi:hypothetical protein